MTEHCDHECVCWMYIEQRIPENTIPCHCNSGGVWPTCKRDTRKRDTVAKPTLIPMRDCFGKFDDCPCEDECTLSLYCEKYSESLRMQCNIQCNLNEEHDAAVAKAEREKVINEACKINNEDRVCKKGDDCKDCLWNSLRAGGK